MTTDNSYSSNQAIDDRLRKLEFVASQICTERSIRMEHARESGSPGERLTNLEQRLAALLETETETEETEMSRTSETDLTEEQEACLAKAVKNLHLTPDELKKLRESLKATRQTHARAEASVNSDGLDSNDLKVQRLLGASTTQIQR